MQDQFDVYMSYGEGEKNVTPESRFTQGLSTLSLDLLDTTAVVEVVSNMIGESISYPEDMQILERAITNMIDTEDDQQITLVLQRIESILVDDRLEGAVEINGKRSIPKTELIRQALNRIIIPTQK